MGKLEIFENLKLLEKEKNIPVGVIIEKIKKAIITACKNSYGGNENVIVNINEELGAFEVYLLKTVVKTVEDPDREIELEEAKKIDPLAKIDEEARIKLDTKDFGRIAAQTARNVIRQGIKDVEKEIALQEFEDKLYTVCTAVVERVEPRNLIVKIGKFEAVLTKNEMLFGDDFHEGDHIKVYVAEIKITDRGARPIISRTRPEMLVELFKTEVPEIAQGIVEIAGVARESSSRAKVAVKSNDPNVDPIGSCIGSKGARINAVVDELHGEKIDIIEYSENPREFIASALLPAQALMVEILDEEQKLAKAIVPDEQLSLAIGNKGQNVRLAARLTGYKIDIKSANEGF